MNEDELLQNDELMFEIDEKEKLNKDERINPERFMECVYNCILTGDECTGDDCSVCDIARNEIVGDVRGDILGRYPTIKKENGDVEYFINWSNTVMELKSVKDLLNLPKYDWIRNLEHVKELSDEILDSYNCWTTIKNVCLQNDEIIEYWYKKDYPIVFVCKNATYVVAPSILND